jgi:putative oxygen-independent coproporphyrinogen III oxidase
MATNIPFAIYLHFPWCVKKCPYCDFNSYSLSSIPFPEDSYFSQLCRDFSHDWENYSSVLKNKQVGSIFMGGGTPSLFSPKTIAKIIDYLAQHFHFAENLEITLEANPGTINVAKCRDFLHAGVSRISLGVQSFQDEKLKILGRIHGEQQAREAVEAIIKAGFTNINIDLMFGLPGQSVADALDDLTQAMDFAPSHLSWYQLTIEPNTDFYVNPPQDLPTDDLLWEIQQQGQDFLRSAGMLQYEISAYAKTGDINYQCQHNINYWEFGDYLGIGAGAHGKITDVIGKVKRLAKISDPKQYLAAKNYFLAEEQTVTGAELFFEFMMNALRLSKPISFALLKERTMLEVNEFLPKLRRLEQAGLLQVDANFVETTTKGKMFLNELLEILLP